MEFLHTENIARRGTARDTLWLPQDVRRENVTLMPTVAVRRPMAISSRVMDASRRSAFSKVDRMANGPLAHDSFHALQAITFFVQDLLCLFFYCLSRSFPNNGALPTLARDFCREQSQKNLPAIIALTHDFRPRILSQKFFLEASVALSSLIALQRWLHVYNDTLQTSYAASISIITPFCQANQQRILEAFDALDSISHAQDRVRECIEFAIAQFRRAVDRVEEAGACINTSEVDLEAIPTDFSSLPLEFMGFRGRIEDHI